MIEAYEQTAIGSEKIQNLRIKRVNKYSNFLTICKKFENRGFFPVNIYK